MINVISVKILDKVEDFRSTYQDSDFTNCLLNMTFSLQHVRRIELRISDLVNLIHNIEMISFDFSHERV